MPDPRPCCRAEVSIPALRERWRCSLDQGHKGQHVAYGVGHRGDERPYEMRWSDPVPTPVQFSADHVEQALTAYRRQLSGR